MSKMVLYLAMALLCAISVVSCDIHGEVFGSEQLAQIEKGSVSFSVSGPSPQTY